MKKPTHANTLKNLNVCMGQEELMIKVSANTDIPACVYISKQGDVKKGTTVISSMPDVEIITIQLRTMRQEVSLNQEDPLQINKEMAFQISIEGKIMLRAHHKTLLF